MMTLLLLVGRVSAQPTTDVTGTEAFRLRLLAAARPTPDQEVQLDQILQTYRQSLENWHRQNDEKRKALQRLQQDALQSGDQGTLQAVQRDLRAMMASQRELRQTLLNQMEDVLDKEQFARVRLACKPEFAGPAVLELLRQLQLTEGQNQQIQTLLDQAAKTSRSKSDPADREEIMNDAIEEMQQVVLTPPQRDALLRL
ncbi:MAG: hypothetical protein PHW08_14910, partial [Kiritimatiellae bacterium]|nr:hypothetical protein [Kiritimatiellia bacterium]